MKKMGVLGTGMVGITIADKLIFLGYDVMLGSRSGNNEKSVEWIKNKGNHAKIGNFAQTAAFGDILFLCVKGEKAIEVVNSLDPAQIKGKTILDITNPLDFSSGMPPFLVPSLTNTNSLGEEIQKIIPEANIVKTLNIVSCTIMVSKQKPGGNPTMFVSGNNSKAKQEATNILREFYWDDIIDLGDITTSRGTEMILPLWVRTMLVLGHGNFAFKASR